MDTLWRENQDLVQEFLNNGFLNFQAESTTEDTLASYQYYAIVSYSTTSGSYLILRSE